ncbi:adhesion G protein-coupled receptor F5-like isoform 1-T2 [Mantella aurantiaca]
MTDLSPILYLFLCLPFWQASSRLSEEDLHRLTSSIFQLDNHVALHREVREASGDLSYYESDIEISFSDPSLEAEIRRHMQKLDIYTPLLDTTAVTNADLVPTCNLNEAYANCSCGKDYDCLGTLGPCSDTGCICITSLPLQKYCTLKTIMAISPSTLFQGDTVTIDCKFSELGSISWYWNSEKKISDSQKYNISSVWQSALVLYTLKIKDLTDADKGNYTCSLNSNGTLKAQSKILDNIKSLQITPSNDVDSFCDGAAFNLTCCSPDIGEFNVTWTMSGPAGAAGNVTSNTTCSTYILTQNFTELCPTVTNYTCSFQRNEVTTSSKTIKVTYYKRAIITIPSFTKLSAGKNLNVPCQTDTIAKTVWAKITISNIVTDNNLLQKTGVTASWAGTYFCVVYQGNLSTHANLTVTVVPLPAKEEITVYPLQTYVTACENTALIKLTCCVNGSGYTRNFTNGTPPIPETNWNCSSTNITFDCNTKTPVSVSCVIFNSLNDWIQSDAMAISYVQVTAEQSCKAQDGIPEIPSGKTYPVPCQTFDKTMLGTKTFICNNGKRSELQDDCYSAKIFQELLNVQDVVYGNQVQQLLPGLLGSISGAANSEKDTILNSSKTLQFMVEILSTVANISVPVDKSMMQNLMDTVNVVVDKPSAWGKVANQSVILLNSVETFAKKLDFNDTISLKNESKNSNIQLFGQIMNKIKDFNVGFSFQNLTANVVLDKNLWTGNSNKVITIAYATMKDILPMSTKKVVNGLVMSTVVGKTTMTDIDNHTFKIDMTFTENNNSLVKPECVWYDLVQMDWTSSGCNTTDNKGVIECSCNHLTSFSILMGPVEAAFLDIITYIGVGISLACLVITLLIEALVWDSVIKNKTSYIRHVCLVNIAVTLLVADIWFIIGAALEKNKGSAACKAAAFFSFFFYLSLFFWMLTTGLILFYRMVYILHDMSRKTMMIIAFLLGYGCSLLITIVTVASTEPSNKFISDKFCWLDYSNMKPFLAFVVPALTIVFINMLILMVVIFKLMRPTIGEKPGREDRKIVIVIAKTMAVLTPLLGTTWALGIVIVVDPTKIVVHAMFATLNSFQGLFILISTVLLDQKVRKAVGSSLSSSYLGTLRSRLQTTSTDSSGTSRARSNSRKKYSKKMFFGKKASHNLFSTQNSSETTGSSYSGLT